MKKQKLLVNEFNDFIDSLLWSMEKHELSYDLIGKILVSTLDRLDFKLKGGTYEDWNKLIEEFKDDENIKFWELTDSEA